MVEKPALEAFLEWVDLLTNDEILQFRRKLDQILLERRQATMNGNVRLPQKEDKRPPLTRLMKSGRQNR